MVFMAVFLLIFSCPSDFGAEVKNDRASFNNLCKASAPKSGGGPPPPVQLREGRAGLEGRGERGLREDLNRALSGAGSFPSSDQGF